MIKINSISIIIPVYNEEKFINKFVSQVINSNCGRLKKEIIVIDDGSTDETTKILKRIRLKSEFRQVNIRFFFNKTNQGKGASLQTGFLKSAGDIVLVQDADLEYDVANYPQLLEPFFKYGADVVYGSRFISHQPHRVLYYWHFVGNLILTTFSNLFTNLNLTDMETGYKVFRGPLIRKIAPALQSKRFGFEPEITARIAKIPNIKIYEVGISYFGRTYKEGKKIGWRDGILAVWEIIKYNLFV